jgi:hypothetical protein
LKVEAQAVYKITLEDEIVQALLKEIKDVLGYAPVNFPLLTDLADLLEEQHKKAHEYDFYA